jgi:hypothetical protein
MPAIKKNQKNNPASQMKPWNEFKNDEPELAQTGRGLLFQSGACVGHAFLTTIRKDGAPRLHPVSLVYSHDRRYVVIPPASPKCADLKRDSRFALQAFPPPKNEAGEEFYLSGTVKWIQDPSVRHAIIDETGIRVEENEVLFELFLERAMYTRLDNWGTTDELPWHQTWRTPT